MEERDGIKKENNTIYIYMINNETPTYKKVNKTIYKIYKLNLRVFFLTLFR